MPYPSKNAILLGIAFVIVGVIKALCDRWLLKTKVVGKTTRKAHMFDHMFLLWFMKQFLQLFLLLLHEAIQRNWLGFGRFKHGELKQDRENKQRRNMANIVANLGNDNDEGNADDDDDDEELLNVNDIVAGNEDDELLPRNRNARKKASWLIYFPAAFFAQADILLLYFGLKLTYSSSFMMLKGTVAFFTALLSMAFLAQPLASYVWFGVVVATLGFAVSGISDYIHVPQGGYEKYGIAAGDLLIVMAQIMFATKIIYEEKFIRKHSIHPMQFLGREAAYGFFFAAILLIVFNVVDAVQYSNLPNGRLEDLVDAFLQLQNCWRLILAMIGSLLSYIVYIYFGMFLIRDQGALARIMIETFIWLFYWAICVALHWEQFFIAQVPGLCVIAIGSLIYSHILLIPFMSAREPLPDDGPFGNQRNDNLQGNLNAQDGDGNNAPRGYMEAMLAEAEEEEGAAAPEPRDNENIEEINRDDEPLLVAPLIN